MITPPECLWLADDAARTIRTLATSRRLHETGGSLFGYIVDDGDVVVSEAYRPGPAARHERFRLIPDHAHTQRRIEEVHRRTDGRLSYLGDWHTHPGGRATPSGRDRASLGELASDDGMDLASPVMLIVSTTVLRRCPRVRAIRAFQWDTTARREVPVPVTHFS